MAVGEKTYAPAVSDGGHGVVHVDVDPAARPPHPAVDHPHVNLCLLVDSPQCVVGYQLQEGNVCNTRRSSTFIGQFDTKQLPSMSVYICMYEKRGLKWPKTCYIRKDLNEPYKGIVEKLTPEYISK